MITLSHGRTYLGFPVHNTHGFLYQGSSIISIWEAHQTQYTRGKVDRWNPMTGSLFMYAIHAQSRSLAYGYDAALSIRRWGHPSCLGTRKTFIVDHWTCYNYIACDPGNLHSHDTMNVIGRRRRGPRCSMVSIHNTFNKYEHLNKNNKWTVL